ncbi:hypothetical protein EF888_02335 [Silicimonas algicola]|uniref:Uncharacterized protein n=1 Tax=Silicimonas algicola TaxID=1826607 RepID=A0A316GBQ7_9RHOB|nr:hypothetical protein [Silicimonas algicola]AZQ66062.1 hypothetical protein EF888_02335 [Silicimonas algicola]PWK58361.1 hypothetical protein C8D95_101174 [Silicimonas algicola]
MQTISRPRSTRYSRIHLTSKEISHILAKTDEVLRGDQLEYTATEFISQMKFEIQDYFNGREGMDD